jgi:type IV pilus assembly protein PilY1
MNMLRTFRLTLLLCSGAFLAPQALADDIDIFLGSSGGSADAPSVMILIDNSSNWARQAQAWGGGMNQGQAELNAISQTLNALAGQSMPIKVGLALLTPNSGGNGTGGGYIRFGARDMTVTQNRIALQNILAQISQYTNGGGQKNEECCGMAHKDETAALYELYKYFSGLAPYSGGPNSSNPWDDMAGNLTAGWGKTAADQGLTSGWAMDDGIYQSPSTSCGYNYIIYIANNSNGQVGSTENVYQPGVVPALAALPATGVGNAESWTDEWTYFLYHNGAAGSHGGAIATYVLDAYNAQNDAAYSGSLQAAARRGGGRYYQVGSSTAVLNALLTIFDHIQSVNSTFASASLPINASNRTQDKNQIFFPMFRPDANVQPRWFGNLKQYQLVNVNGVIELGDATGQPAVNPLTGYAQSCAQSIWTTDSTDLVNYPLGYWNYPTGTAPNANNMFNITQESIFAKGTCPTTTTLYGPYADLPDGPMVEKGGVAEVIRKGDNPPASNSAPTWSPALRKVKTISPAAASGAFVDFTVANTGLPATLVNWMLGQDVQDENGNGRVLETRPSVHGDEIHSRPLAVDYGCAPQPCTSPVRVFYGSNDGTLRAIDAATGQEVWAFVAPEFYAPAPAVYTPPPAATVTPTGLERLMWSGMTDSAGNQVSPLVKFPGQPAGLLPAPVPKDYYFDGSIGLLESNVNANGVPGSVWIYPSMRRGGRMVYALDVSDVSAPSVLWKFGCPHRSDDLSCASNGTFNGSALNVTSIGQTWSIPSAATSVLGYGSAVVIFGGGYDGCEDQNTSAPACANEKGAGVFVLDAATGKQLGFFPTMRSVAADVALISVATSGVIDHAYAVDTGGNIYRIDFNSGGPGTWVMNRIAYTNGVNYANGAGRKFLYPPALVPAPNNEVYLAIGSGDREHPLWSQYPYTSVVNRFYVFKDSLASTGALDLDDTTKMFDYTLGPGGSSNGTTCATPAVLPTSTMSGWFINLTANGQGEQTVTSALVVAGLVTFSTNRPVPPTAGSCSTRLGAAYSYWLNLFNASGAVGVAGAACGGTRDVPFAGGGLPPSPVLATLPVGIQPQAVDVIIGADCAQCATQPPRTITPARKTTFWKGSGEN